MIQVKVVQWESDRAQEHVLLELVAVPHRGLQRPALDHFQWDPVLQHLHEAGVAVPPHHLGLPLGDLARVWVKIHLHIRVGLLLQD